MAEGLETSLSKIRPHSSSSLSHQKAPATLLHAIEATFEEQKNERTPTAYFAALLTTLDGTLQSARSSGPSLREGDVLPAVIYLLALVTPHVPPAVIRSNLNTIITLTAPLFPTLVPHAPPMRSLLSFYEAVFRALERPQFEAPGLRQAFESILHLGLDPRPKVRKRAAELVKEVLSNAPPPAIRHPYAERVAAWLQASLNEITTGVPKFKGKKSDTEGLDSAIHLLAFLRPILAHLPPSSLPLITSSLLSMPRLGNPYLSQSAYSLLSELLTIPIEDPTNNVRDRLPEILDAVLGTRPPITDATLSPAWVSVLGHTMVAYHEVDPEKTAEKVGETWQASWSFLESSEVAVRKAATQSLELIGKCFTASLIKAAVKEAVKGGQKAVISKIVSQASKALEALAFARAIPDVLVVISSLLSNLRYRDGPDSPTAAETLLLPLAVKIAELRVQKMFEYKEAADATIKRAMAVLGPEVLLLALPLNLDAADRQAGHEPRAFLLPMLSQPHPSPLSHFVSYFVPLTERMFDLRMTAESEDRESEAKVWSVLIDQIWAGLYGYCYGSTNLKEALGPEFSQLLTQLLYSHEDLRPAILKALRAMVESNDALASRDTTRIDKLPEAVRENPISQEAAQANVVFLRTQAESWLAVLFNLFQGAGRNGQGLVGDVISAWSSIADVQEISKAYSNVAALFQENLNKPLPPRNLPGPPQESVAALMLDLLILLLPYLPAGDASTLFNLCLSTDVLESKANGVQKRGYKVLTKLVTSGKVEVDAGNVLQKLEGSVDGLIPAAKKDRITLLSTLVTLIPSTSLHLLPSIIPEAVLGTKEPSEKARNAAFDLIVAMGHKMAAGGTVKRDLMDGMDEDSGEATANIEEYMTMVAGGLAGASPHMISATVTAISRLVFEFKDAVSSQMHNEIFATLLVFLSSANREIVKSALGYIKLAIHTISVDLLRPHLKQIVPALLNWSHDHKNHFKAKVRHIFERLLRRFPWEDVYSHAEHEDARKVLLNIKKRKERAKKKKNREADNEEEDDHTAKPMAGSDAFEDVLYGSESELDDSDDEGASEQTSKRFAGKGGARLRADDDEPMDLLAGAATRVTTSNAKKRRKPGQDASRFKTDDDTGKMVIDEGDSDKEGAAEEDVAGTAYREAITSADGFTRGPNGRVKFNKDTKKRRHDNMEDEDVEMGDGEAAGAGKAHKKKAAKAFGHEFKAKKAGGDVKKGGVDPYAYVSLSQAAKKTGRRDRLGVAGKR